MRYLLLSILAAGLITGAYADGPKQNDKKEKRETKAKKQKKVKLKKVMNANPQHAGYPKADVKGDFPSRIDPNTYYVEE